MKEALKKYKEAQKQHLKLITDYRKVDAKWSSRPASFGKAENTGLLGFGFLGL